MDKYTDVILSDGTVWRGKAVSHLAIAVAVGQYPGCQMPDPPTEEIESKAAGVTNIVLARPGTPQYVEYQARVAKVTDLQARIEDEARYYAGTVGWKQVGSDKFTKSVPKSWKFPQELLDLGVTPKELDLALLGKEAIGRTWDYILYEILGNDQDTLKVARVVYGTAGNALTEDSQEPITEGEVQAVADKFPGTEE